MTFADEAVKSGRRLFRSVELVADSCTKDYGFQPGCTAVVGTTGAAKCYNTFGTCQDTANYVRTSKTYRFSSDSSEPITGYLPWVINISENAQELKGDGTIGGRGSLTVTIADSPWSDVGIDPYITERPNPNGTFWRRWLARNRFYRGRVLRLVEGFIDDSGVLQSQPRTFFIEKVSYKSSKGRNSVTITAHDILRDIDFKTAQVPLQSTGLLLRAMDDDFNASADVNTVTDEVTVTGHPFIGDDRVFYDAAGFPLGGLIDNTTYYVIVVDVDTIQLATSAGGAAINITAQANNAKNYLLSLDIEVYFEDAAIDIDDEYETSGKLRVGDEVMTFARSAGSKAFAVVRQDNGVLESHDVDDVAQQCYVQLDEPYHDVMYDLLVNPTNATTHRALIDPAFIDKAAWDTEVATFRPLNNASRTITEPEDVSEQLGKLSVLNQSNLFWDDVNLLVKLKAIEPPTLDPFQNINDKQHIVDSSFSETEKTSEQSTQVWLAFNQRNPAGDADKLRNFATIRVSVDVVAEGDDEYGKAFVRDIFATWFGASQAGVATALAATLVRELADPPLDYQFTLDVKDAKDLALGDNLLLSAREIIDADGNQESVVCFVKSRQAIDGNTFRYKARRVGVPRRFARWMDENTATPDFDDATQDEKNNGAYWASPVSGFATGAPGYGTMPDGSSGYLWG